jgi:branched-chain amino acid transport system permease protein
MNFFIAEIINAIKLGSIYALIAIGYSIVYSILGLINFAHGDLMMVAVYSLWVLMNLKIPFALAVILAVIITMLLAIITERVAYRPLLNNGEETLIITSLAVSILLQSISQAVFGIDNKALKVPDFFTKRIQIADFTVSVMNFVILAVTIVSVIVLAFILKKTRIGLAMRAIKDNSLAADFMGINRKAVIVAAFGIGSALAALAGITYTGEYVSFDPQMGFMLGIKAFIAAVIGGLGSITGAALGAFVLAFLEIFFAGYLPDSIASYQTVFVFLILILVLLVRPDGLLGKNAKRS